MPACSSPPLPRMELPRDDAGSQPWREMPSVQRVRCSPPGLPRHAEAGASASFADAGIEFGRLAQTFSEALRAAWTQRLIVSLADQVAELKARVMALEAHHDPTLAELQRRREEEIYDEMRSAGFDPDDHEDDLDPRVPQEVWDAVLAEV
jgi:hypothetical protein